MLNLSVYLERYTKRIQTALDAQIPGETTPPADLHKAMRYSIFAGGKRLRPILCLAAAEVIGGDTAPAILPAIALEALHTYTLIHDDLPAMDNDELRRGKPTCHVVFGEATAILAGDALLTLAFEWLAQTQAPPPYHPNQLSLELARAAGSLGVIGGQVEDLQAEGQPPNAERMEAIHRRKTGALLRASVRMGGIAAGAAHPALDALTGYGEKVGLAFQIMDDILNETSSARALGKSAHTDRRHGKMTYVAVHGLDAARRRVAQLTKEAIAAIQTLQGSIEPLAVLAQSMGIRTH
ncbi:MAG: polyprenyl synthetase family protein [Kiritimatiellae bacterium]|nr:polyprenyl synthetase family protein [Verrucomicrobiota bacterium]MBU4289611.1 polyprenyl synthetase family protein [Verrucomicrobiota bacterium]MCG2680205.1 polyprenyl synthetase family protein [Kiritimatiellia bacterium]